MTALIISAVLLICLARATEPAKAVRPPSVRAATAFLICSALAGAALRAWDISRSLWRDEFGTLWAVEGGLYDSIVRVIGFHGQSPFYYLFAWAFLQVFGESEVVLRIPSLLFGVGTAVFTGLAAALVSGRAAGLFAGGLVWMSASVTGASVNARPYALGMLCAAIALYGFLGAVRFGTRRYRLTFTLAAAALVLTHYLYGLLLVGLALGYVTHSSLRARYSWKSSIQDVLLVIVLCSLTVPQILALWERKASLVWTNQPDYVGLARALVPFLVAVTLSLFSTGERSDRAERHTLLLSGITVLGILWGASARGITLLIPRYFEVVVVPAAVLAAIGIARSGGTGRFLGLTYAVLITSTSLVAGFMASGHFSAATVLHEDWRAAIAELARAQRREPGPVLVQSGFVEQVDGRVDRDSAVLAPLRLPGHSRPDWDLRLLPFAWDSRTAVTEREALVPLLEQASPVYFISGGGYTELFLRWADQRLEGRLACVPLGTYVSVELTTCRATGSAQPVVYGSSGAK